MAPASDLPGFFVRYAEAFSAFALERLLTFLDEPLVIVTDDRTHAFHDRITMRNNMEGLFRVYRRLGVSRAVPVSVLGQPYAANPALAGAEVTWSMQEYQGRQVLRFSTGYLLRRHGDDWRIAVAVSYDEPPKLARALAAAEAKIA